MPTYYDYDTQTSSYTPGLKYDNIPGVTIAGTPTTSFFIPMILTSYQAPTHQQQVNPQAVIPITVSGGVAIAGQINQMAGPQFPRILLGGTIDVDLVDDTEIGTYAGANAKIPSVQVNSIPMHWATLIAVFYEGRFGSRIDPTYYLDPYGREFNLPRIVDYTATYIAGVPARANFTLQLMLPHSS